MHQLTQTILQKIATAALNKSMTEYGRKKGWKWVEEQDAEKRKEEHLHMYDSEWMIFKRKYLPSVILYGVIIAVIVIYNW